MPTRLVQRSVPYQVVQPEAHDGFEASPAHFTQRGVERLQIGTKDLFRVELKVRKGQLGRERLLPQEKLVRERQQKEWSGRKRAVGREVAAHLCRPLRSGVGPLLGFDDQHDALIR
jgi:hypothetical protein